MTTTTEEPHRFLVCVTCQGWGHVTVHSDGWRTTGVCPECLGNGGTDE